MTKDKKGARGTDEKNTEDCKERGQKVRVITAQVMKKGSHRMHTRREKGKRKGTKGCAAKQEIRKWGVLKATKAVKVNVNTQKKFIRPSSKKKNETRKKGRRGTIKPGSTDGSYKIELRVVE